MIENPRRQALIVLVVAAFALFFAVGDEPSLGLDLKGGTQLIYDLPIAEAKEQGLVDKDRSNTEIMKDTLGIIAERVDPTGTREAGIQQRGETGFMIELPDVGETEAEILKRQIETLGRLEMRLVANTDYDVDGVRFEIAQEKERLEAWLNDGDNRAKIAKNPEQIERFNNLTDNTGRLDKDNLRWFARKIGPAPGNSSTWDHSIASYDTGVVTVFEAAELQTPPPVVGPDDEEPFKVELLPINMHAQHFTGEDMNGAGVRAGTDPDTGTPCVFYEIAAGKKSDYADWSEDNTGNKSAIILNGFVRSAPNFRGRIYGVGLITGGFTQAEAAGLAKVIKTGSLQIKPEFVSRATIGATLGQRSVDLGIRSLVVGGVLVLLFILIYYRTAGLVAFAAIALNIFLIFGVVQFIRATITLPGIAGLVLTMGMAVDANILIYERIREELRKGKEILQAVRTGFDRAMVTILDANLTTFLAGVVLYNVGVGPVRGFAVTMMVGIMTSLFTALVFSRLVFHYLLESKKLTEFKTANWFSTFDFDFVKKGRAAFMASMIAIVAGLAYVATVPSDQMLGLDFTGGAGMELRLSKSMTEQQLREKLEADETFSNKYPSPQINRLGEDGTAFSVKLKLTQEQRTELEAERKKAKESGKTFEPPFKREVLDITELPLMQRAFTAVRNVELPGGQGTSNLAQAEIHLQTPVKVADVLARLNDRYGETSVQPEEGQATNLFVEFPVRKEANETEITDMVALALEGLKDANGEPFALSNPIPSAEVIGDRMVGELRTAATGAMIISLFLIVMYIRLRFREYKYGLAAVAALVHDVIISLVLVVFFNAMGLTTAEIDLPMIAAFLTIIGYSINDTIVIFDRVRENLSEKERLGDTKESFGQLLNRSINQTLSRTILTSGTTLFVVLAVFVVNRGSGSGLEGFSFAMIIGILSGTYSTMFIASPMVLWLRNREAGEGEGQTDTIAKASDENVAVKGSA